MPQKKFSLLIKDAVFYITGRADVAPAAWSMDSWLYPLDFSYQLCRERHYFCPKDETGIPMRDYPGSLGCQYLVSRIAGYAFAHWNQWRRMKSELNRSIFVRTADWFLKAPRGRYEHLFPVAGMNTPWISCNSQGEAASVLCRAFLETGNEVYFQQAQAALAPFLVSVEQGGLQSRLPDGRPFLEEYPGTQYRHVLNGCLYALVGICDVRRLSNNSNLNYDRLFHGLIDAIGNNLDAWNINGWSTYDYSTNVDSPRNFNTMTYQLLQATLLLYLSEVSGDSRLQTMGLHWQKNAGYLGKRLGAFYQKTRYRLKSGW